MALKPLLSTAVLSCVLAAATGVGADPVSILPIGAFPDQTFPSSPPAPAAAPGEIRISAAPGEFEPASFVVATTTGLSAVTVQANALSGPAGTLPASAIDLRILKSWYQSGHDATETDESILVPELLLKDAGLVTADAGVNRVRLPGGSQVVMSTPADLPGRLAVPISQFPVQDATTLQAVDIAADGHEQFWITLHLPASTAPGRYSGALDVLADGTPIGSQPLVVEVLPIDLDAAPQLIEYSIYYRAELDPVGWPNGSISSEWKSETQLRAELRNMLDHGVTNPTVYQSLDGLDRYLEIRNEVGMGGQPLYYLGVGTNSAAADWQTAMSIAAARGVPSPVYFHGWDEARGSQLTSQRAAWTALRALGGAVFVAGYRTTAWQGPGNFDLMGDIQDLLVCAFRPSREEAALWHGNGHRIYNYENPQGGHEHPTEYRWNFGILLWQNDYDGSMTYAYQDSKAHIWNDFDSTLYRDQNMTYPTVDGVIDTIQWEGMREAVDDVRYLGTLLARIDERNTDGTRDTTGAQAFVDALRDAARYELDLDRTRDTVIGHILDLQDESLPAPSLSIADVRTEPLDAPAALRVRWDSSDRSRGRLEYGTTPALGTLTDLGAALVHHHEHEIAGLPADTTIYVQAVSVDTAGAETRSAVLAVDTATALSVAFSAGTPPDGATLSGNDLAVGAEFSGDYRASAFVDLDGSLLAWWRFEEGAGTLAQDSSSYANDCSLLDGAGWTSGRIGGGALLDGINDFIACGDLGVAADGTATVEGWFRFDALPTQKVGPVGLFTGLYAHPENEHFYIWNSNEWFRTSADIGIGTWHHIALTWDGDNSTAALYLDGRPYPIVVSGAESMPALSQFRLGKGFGWMAGAVDEVRVWSRVLSEAEILASLDAASHRLEVAFEGQSTGSHAFEVVVVSAANTLARSALRTVTLSGAPTVPVFGVGLTGALLAAFGAFALRRR